MARHRPPRNADTGPEGERSERRRRAPCVGEQRPGQLRMSGVAATFAGLVSPPGCGEGIEPRLPVLAAGGERAQRTPGAFGRGSPLRRPRRPTWRVAVAASTAAVADRAGPA